jgi:hypothetical protein
VFVGEVFKKRGVDPEHVANVEGADIEHEAGGDLSGPDRVDRRQRVEPAQPCLDRFQGLARSIGFVEHDNVGEGDLLARLVMLQLERDVFRIDDGDERIEDEILTQHIVEHEGLDDRRGIGETRGLDDEAVDVRAAFQETRDGADQVAAHRAADTTIAELDHRLVGRVHQLAVDADLAELVDDDRDLLAGTLLQEVVEQCRLAGAEKSREDGRWNLAHGVGPEATGEIGGP